MVTRVLLQSSSVMIVFTFHLATIDALLIMIPVESVLIYVFGRYIITIVDHGKNPNVIMVSNGLSDRFLSQHYLLLIAIWSINPYWYV